MNSFLSWLQLLQAGTILSPRTAELIMCAPSVAGLFSQQPSRYLATIYLNYSSSDSSTNRKHIFGYLFRLCSSSHMPLCPYESSSGLIISPVLNIPLFCYYAALYLVNNQKSLFAINQENKVQKERPRAEPFYELTYETIQATVVQIEEPC